MIEDKVCCNCKHNVRKAKDGDIQCYCDIDGEWLSYTTVMEHKCKHWAKEKERKQ